MEKGIEREFADAIEMRDKGTLQEAVAAFLEIIRKYPEDAGIGATHLVLGGVYYDLKDYDNSLENFSKAAHLKPKSELASLGVYLSHVDLGNHESAIHELKRYLDQYPAKLYKDTLVELLHDLEKGNALKFKDTILNLAARNRVSLGRG